MNLREQALEEYKQLTMSEVPNLEHAFSYADKNLPELASNIWQAIDKATNLCMLLWSLKLEQEAGKLEDLKIYLRNMHRVLADEMKAS